MDYYSIEYNLILTGCVVALLLGVILLVIKTPSNVSHESYAKGKNTCALAILIFGAELLFQWLIRFHLVLKDSCLSKSIYLLSFCGAVLLVTVGFCEMLAPSFLDKRQRAISWMVFVGYFILLAINYLLPNEGIKRIGIYVCCGVLFLINCLAVYKSVVIYQGAISSMRTYYSDVVENLIRWTPGVGVGFMIFFISAPIVCLCPKVVVVYQLALGIIMFVYTFVCIINFSFTYERMYPVLQGTDSGDLGYEGVDISGVMLPQSGERARTLSQSLQEVLSDKELRWQANGGYRTPGITIDHVSHEMGTNRSYLSRYLNEVRHMTFYEWVAQMRIAEAKSLLSDGNGMTIEQIALQVGFTSTSTFSNTFKKLEGVSPKKWRNQ